MAVVLPFQRRRAAGAPAAAYSSEAFWRNSMVPASVAMGVIIVGALVTLVVGLKTGWLRHDYSNWVLVAALVSVIGLTKIVIANMFFFVLMQDEARLDPPPAPPPPSPGTRVERERRPARTPSRALWMRPRRRRPDRRRRAATLSTSG